MTVLASHFYGQKAHFWRAVVKQSFSIHVQLSQRFLVESERPRKNIYNAKKKKFIARCTNLELKQYLKSIL